VWIFLKMQMRGVCSCGAYGNIMLEWRWILKVQAFKSHVRCVALNGPDRQNVGQESDRPPLQLHLTHPRTYVCLLSLSSVQPNKPIKPTDI